MYCNFCGSQIQDDARVCAYCARPIGARVAPPPPRRDLVRPREGRKLGGVALGMANYWAEDVTLVRLLFVFVLLLTFPLAIIVYIVAWIIIPEEPLQLPAQGTVGSPAVQS